MIGGAVDAERPSGTLQRDGHFPLSDAGNVVGHGETGGSDDAGRHPSGMRRLQRWACVLRLPAAASHGRRVISDGREGDSGKAKPVYAQGLLRVIRFSPKTEMLTVPLGRNPLRP